MANPRVFISSTCYDLSEVRDSLIDFVHSYGFDPVLSERGDVFYHPDAHTHESCIAEVSNCHLFILIIGGRFGGAYKADPQKSIVNAEYAAARQQKIPVFSFVKRSVYSDHFVFVKNKGNDAVTKIIFPSIENNDHAARIFNFIDEVRLSPVNNGFFPFDFAREIVELLRKQWAGMFYDFLQRRATNDQIQAATSLLGNVSIASDKLEELVKRLYRHLDAAGADATIDDVEQRSVLKAFLDECIDVVDNESPIHFTVDVSAYENWYEYLAAVSQGKIEDLGGDMLGISWNGSGRFLRKPDSPVIEERNERLQARFTEIKRIDSELVRAVMDEYLEKKSEPTDKETNRSRRKRRS